MVKENIVGYKYKQKFCKACDKKGKAFRQQTSAVVYILLFLGGPLSLLLLGLCFPPLGLLSWAVMWIAMAVLVFIDCFAQWKCDDCAGSCGIDTLDAVAFFVMAGVLLLLFLGAVFGVIALFM